jgi:beta-hydroxyacyl-ACP dehydratase FabZ
MPALTCDEILKALPHRYPMLLVDRILECDDAKRIVGLKCVTINDPFFQGHFPGAPVMPGVLQLEAMAQTGGILLNRILKSGERVPYFMAIDNAKFRKVVRPGDVMRIEVDITNMRSRVARFHGQVLVDGAVASEADLMCMVTDRKADA